MNMCVLVCVCVCVCDIPFDLQVNLCGGTVFARCICHFDVDAFQMICRVFARCLLVLCSDVIRARNLKDVVSPLYSHPYLASRQYVDLLPQLGWHLAIGYGTEAADFLVG